jgi:hypothetical protein
MADEAPVANATDQSSESNGESTTPEEVAQVLKSSGMNIDTPTAVDEEEGTDPDTVVDEDPAPEAPAEDPEPEQAPPEVKPQPPTQPDQTDTADDKYSFEVTDANGVTFKIPVGAKMEDILAEFEPKNNGQVLDILNQLQKLEGQKTADDAQAQTEAETAARSERASELLKVWGDEAKDLQAQKRIATGEDGNKRVNEVYKFMADENDKRMNAGKPTLNSFEDALDKLEAKEGREAKVEQDKAEKEEARKNGALVGGSSAASTSSAPTYKGGAKNANQALRAMGLLN